MPRLKMTKYFSSTFMALLFLSFNIAITAQANDMYIVTSADTEHFPWLQVLIRSTIQHNYAKLSEIAVFDLGLTQSDIETLKSMPFVRVYQIEEVNPDIRKKFLVRSNGRLARGWYSWKPVIFYQALQMFPYFFYIDSSIEVIAPLDDIFDEIKREGYYLVGAGHPILPHATNRVKQLFDLDLEENKWILDQQSISAGIQGISRALLDSYIIPIYILAANIKNFEDDGSAPTGFGGSRHDQPLFSTLAAKLHLKINANCAKYLALKKNGVNNDPFYEHAVKHNLIG